MSTANIISFVPELADTHGELTAVPVHESGQ